MTLRGLGFKGCYPDYALRIGPNEVLKRLEIRNCAVLPQIMIENLSKLTELEIGDSDVELYE